MTLKVSTAQRRAWLVARHRLATPASTVTGATETMVALHATDPVTVYLAARARVRSATTETVDEALYAERRIVRMLGMRRTVFVVPTPLLPVVQRACTDDVARQMRGRLERDLSNAGIGGTDAAAWLRDTEAGVLRALAARGSATGAQLAADEPRLRTQLVYAVDKSYGGPANITSRVLVLIAAEGHMIRGHRRGGWSSGQFEWFPARAWLAGADDRAGAAGGAANETGANQGGAGADDRAGAASGAARESGAGPGRAGAGGAGSAPGQARLDAAPGQARLDAAPGQAGLDAAAARAELARRWLRAFGPAPASDLQWWAGWTGAQAKAALAALPVREVDLDGQPGDWYLGPHGPALFDRTGNIGPTVWWEGRIVGGWAQRPSGEVAWRLLEDVGSGASAAISAEAAALEAWLGPA